MLAADSAAHYDWVVKTPTRVTRLVGSKWTSAVTRVGWRHFEVVSVRGNDAGEYDAELAASCDRSSRVWVNANELLTREGWQPGWSRLTG